MPHPRTHATAKLPEESPMKSQSSTPARPRLHRLSAGVLAAMFLAVLIPLGTGEAVAQEEKTDYAKISQGKSLFRAWCRSCHGEAAKGDGPMAEHLRPKPGDLTLLSKKEGGQFYFGRVTAKIDGRDKVKGHGSKDMPVWGEAFLVVDEEGGEEAVRKKINALAHFLRSIQATGK